MVKDEAELTKPDSGDIAATCPLPGGTTSGGTKQPVSLSTTHLAGYGTTEAAKVVLETANDWQDKVIRELGVDSAVDPLPDEVEFFSIGSAEGFIGTLLIVLANGKLHRDER